MYVLDCRPITCSSYHVVSCCIVRGLPYVLYCSQCVSCCIVPYCTPRGNTVRTADCMYCAGFAVCTHCIVGLTLTLTYRVVSYCAGFAVCRTIALYRLRFVSYHVVSYCASGRTVLTLSSDRVVLSRPIVSRFHSRGSCSDRILIFPRLYHDFSQAVLYETYPYKLNFGTSLKTKFPELGNLTRSWEKLGL
jgi:hypothetical protein